MVSGNELLGLHGRVARAIKAFAWNVTTQDYIEVGLTVSGAE